MTIFPTIIPSYKETAKFSNENGKNKIEYTDGDDCFLVERTVTSLSGVKSVSKIYIDFTDNNNSVFQDANGELVKGAKISAAAKADEIALYNQRKRTRALRMGGC